MLGKLCWVEEVEMSSSKGATSSFSDDELDTLSLWDVPDVSVGTSEDISLDEAEATVLTAEDIDAVQKQAYHEAFAKGEKLGFAEGKKLGFAEGKKLGYQESKNLLEQKAKKITELLKSLNEPFEQLDEEVEKSIVQLSLLIAKQVINDELKQDPEKILKVVKQTLKVLPIANNKISISLHPEDALLVKEGFAQEEGLQQWNLVEDAAITRGGCLVKTAISQIDQTVETRISEMVALILDEDVRAEESE